MGEITFRNGYSEALVVDIYAQPKDFFVDVEVLHNGWRYRWACNSQDSGQGTDTFVSLYFDGPDEVEAYSQMDRYVDHYETLGLPQLRGAWDEWTNLSDLMHVAWELCIVNDTCTSSLRLWRDAILSPGLLTAMVRKYGEPRTVDEVFEKYGLR